ncbi:hypothetical protein [Rodentibacter haemolyticus]|uniref:Lipoprotein n=1 Tax=Rodentibacter haemolyticus TaxID=2778911 RepID=A0ABX6UYT9_9PAST|nr:hypothetical protein [Rodentibacter haemolyticus]QPB43224.1 hypothetical protein IHV77_03715 [Rodentibacter haemolyticus]
MKNKILLVISILLFGCSTYQGDFIVRWWGGDYSVKSSAEVFKKKEKEFYENESIGKKY